MATFVYSDSEVCYFRGYAQIWVGYIFAMVDVCAMKKWSSLCVLTLLKISLPPLSGFFLVFSCVQDGD